MVVLTIGPYVCGWQDESKNSHILLKKFFSTLAWVIAINCTIC